MTSQQQFTEKDEAQFWEIVVLCLTTFHYYDRSAAEGMVGDLRDRLTKSSPRVRDFAFHDEPFNLACDLSGKNLDLREHTEAYDKIVENIGA